MARGLCIDDGATTKAVRKPQQQTSDEARPKLFGQQTALTHPHLVKPEDFVTGIKKDEFRRRRDDLVQQLVSKDRKRHLVVIPSAKKKYMSGKIPYVFRQQSDFFYLTGNLEHESCLVLEVDGESYTSTMFLRPKDKHTEMWDGVVTGLGEGPSFFGVDHAVDVKDLSNFLSSAYKANSHDVIWYNQEESEFRDVTSTVAELVKGSTKVDLFSPTALIQQQRLLKSPAEQELMRQTCRIASEAINETMAWVRPGISEHHLFAKVDYECRLRNASYLAYPPVVAGGVNATTIHYISNNQVVQEDDAVLMDAGCEYGGYTSDITRTFPVGSRFTEPQRVLYEIILQVQKDLIRCLQEESVSLDMLFEIMCLQLGGYLKEINFIPKHLSGVDLARAAYKFCPHHVSHYLGMDVHDTGSISRGIPLAPGTVFTIEPGVYISRDRRDVPEEFRGIGVRIEDDALIDDNNKLEILTASCKKELKDIER